ncbi:MAG: GyrI-like domain-containing protein [Cognaticolwellia sp.]
MKLQQVNGFTLAGYSVRTSNIDEVQPGSAKIGDLWTKFYNQQASKFTETSKIYGVYTDYESDVNGQYTVFAAADTLINDETLPTLDIASGSYLVFSAQGEMPGAVVKLWQDVWQYFTSEDCAYQRAYTTDFEHYTGATSVDIYIAIITNLD